MGNDQPNTEQARSLRQSQTKSEGLLWSLLRAKQVCQLKFRRQYPIESWIVDFACPKEMLIIEIDGGYHDHTVDADLRRQRALESLGWKILRFSDKQVEEDAEAVALAIARELNIPYTFHRRKATGSGMKKQPKPEENE
jgi:leucyl-tRNA synthetase